MSRIGLIDYGMGNLHSVQRALQRLDAEVQPVRCAADMVACDGLVLPGVGAFDPAMERFPGAEMIVRGRVDNTFVNCARYIHPHQRVRSSDYVPDERGLQAVG